MYESIIGVARDAQSANARPRAAVTIAAGETGTLAYKQYHADAATAYNLSGVQLLLTVWSKERYAPIISRQLTPTSPTTGVGNFPILIGDTAGLLGAYRYDVWLTDTNYTPNLHYQVVGVSSWMITEALGQLGQDVTVPPSQEPLAQGLPGLVWRGTWSSLTAYVIGDAVSRTVAGITSSWIAVAASTNVTPVAGAYWNLVASGGSSSSAPSVATAASLPDATVYQGQGVVVTDTNILYFANGGAWWPIAVLQ